MRKWKKALEGAVSMCTCGSSSGLHDFSPYLIEFVKGCCQVARNGRSFESFQANPQQKAEINELNHVFMFAALGSDIQTPHPNLHNMEAFQFQREPVRLPKLKGSRQDI